MTGKQLCQRWFADAEFVALSRLLEQALKEQRLVFIEKNRLKDQHSLTGLRWYDKYKPSSFGHYLDLKTVLLQYEEHGTKYYDLRGYSNPAVSFFGICLNDADLSYIHRDMSCLAELPSLRGRELNVGINQMGFPFSVLENCRFVDNDLTGISDIGYYSSRNLYVNVCLDRATLSRVCFSNCVFQKCSLVHLAACSIIATNCTFERCDFSRTFLGRCKLVDTQFRRCNFRKAWFDRDGTYENCQFVDCNMKDLDGGGFVPG